MAAEAAAVTTTAEESGADGRTKMTADAESGEMTAAVTTARVTVREEETTAKVTVREEEATAAVRRRAGSAVIFPT